MTARTPIPSLESTEVRAAGLTFGSLRGFFLAAFGLSWGAGMLYVVFQAQLDAVFGPMGYTNPVFILMVYSPGIAGVFMVWRHYGNSGLREFFRRFMLADVAGVVASAAGRDARPL